MMAQSIPPEARSDLETARMLTLVAMIFQAIFLLIGLFVFLFFVVGGFLMASAVAASIQGTTLTQPQSQPMVALAILPLLIITGFGLLPLIFLLLTYFLVYKRLTEGQVEVTLTPALILGILSLLLGGVISGILLIVAYVKIKDAHVKMLMAQRSGM